MSLILAVAGCVPAIATAPAIAASDVAGSTAVCAAPEVSVFASFNNRTWQGNVKLVRHPSCGTEAIALCEFAPNGSTFMGALGNEVKQVGAISTSGCLPGWIVKSITFRWWNGHAWVYN